MPVEGIKQSEFSEVTSLQPTDFLTVIRGGTNAKIRVSNIQFGAAPEVHAFQNSNLVGGILTQSHGFGTSLVGCKVYSPDLVEQLTAGVVKGQIGVGFSNTEVRLDFNGNIDPGTWLLIIYKL